MQQIVFDFNNCVSRLQFIPVFSLSERWDCYENKFLVNSKLHWNENLAAICEAKTMSQNYPDIPRFNLYILI